MSCYDGSGVQKVRDVASWLFCEVGLSKKGVVVFVMSN